MVTRTWMNYSPKAKTVDFRTARIVSNPADRLSFSFGLNLCHVLGRVNRRNTPAEAMAQLMLLTIQLYLLMEIKMKQQSGFTLVEIAIVLVIIGLLLGGVLKGQELITQAKIKNIANDLNGMTAAVYAYQDRYKRFPGDDNGAATRWPVAGSVAAATDGNGDAAVGLTTVTAAVSCTPTGTGENCTFWNHLRRSGLIAGNAASAETPLNAVGGFLHVQTNALGLTGLVVCSTNLLGKVASAIDAQFDDGNPATGTVRAGTTLATNTAATAYLDDGATVYTVCKTI